MNKKDNEKFVELIWHGKYKDFDLKGRVSPERANLPFQVIETVNEPRLKEWEGSLGKEFYPKAEYPENYPPDWRNILIWGDNKLVLTSLLKQGWAGKINLIYIDPPFFTGADFTIRAKVGDKEVEKEPSIIEERAYKDIWKGGIASYLQYMYERLVLMRELLAENGSIYVHLDWHVGHYVKVMMDEIFGYENFVNEIIWHYSRWTAEAKKFQKMHDTILWYSKTNNYTYNLLYQPYKNPEWIEDTIRKVVDGKLVRVKTSDGKYVKRGKENIGVPMHDVWEDINFIAPTAEERIQFDTQKPEALLRRIILASSNTGDIVADFFCGSGTTLAVAEKLGRRWIGCDLSKFAIQVTRKRLLDIHNSKDLMEDENEY